MKMEDLILYFQKILLQLFKKMEKERSITAPYYILIGKRSGQSIQDVGIFQLHNYFSILPKLTKKFYNGQIEQLIQKGIIAKTEDGSFQILHNKFQNTSSNLFFDGWHYRGNEHVFFAKLSLIVQALSHKKEGDMSFIPIQKDEQIQQSVRHFLLTNGYQKGNLNVKLFIEMNDSLQRLQCDEKAKNIVLNRFIGYHLPGLTWSQLAFQEKLEEIDIQLLYVSCLHSWLNEITNQSKKYPLLSQVAEGIRFQQPLTDSAYQTAQLFKKGYSINEISHIRNIKESTVEDHLVELAMSDLSFNIYQFVSEKDVQLVSAICKQQKTKKLKVLKELIPHLSFFQLRLALTRGEKI